jgi:pyrroline-5-carboxylate reductase
VVALFDPLGRAIPVEQEAVFNVFGTATAVMASYFAFAGTISGWMERHGVAHQAARTFVRQMLEGLATAGPDRTFEALADEHQTRGGINEQVVRAIATDGIMTSLDEALDAALASMQRSASRDS